MMRLLRPARPDHAPARRQTTSARVIAVVAVLAAGGLAPLAATAASAVEIEPFAILSTQLVLSEPGVIADFATVEGVDEAPTGSVSYSLYGPNDTICDGTPIFTGSGPLVTNAQLKTSYGQSGPVPISAPGVYRAVASYAGDDNNSPDSGACNDPGETLTVEKAAPAIASKMSDPGVVGGEIGDTAWLTGAWDPTGTMSFNYYGPDDATCTGTPYATNFVPLGADAPTEQDPVVSPGIIAHAPGTYRARASYSGDSRNAAVSGACNDPNESTTVDLARPTISSQMSPDIVLGGDIRDTAQLHGGVNPTGTVHFFFYGPGDEDCSDEAVFSADAAVDAQGAAVSPDFTPTVPGTYRARAAYNGDDLNAYGDAQGECNDPGESVVVTKIPTVIGSEMLKTGFPGNTTRDTAVVTNLGSSASPALVEGGSGPTPTGTVTFTFYAPGDDNCTGDPVATSTSEIAPGETGVAVSADVEVTTSGTYRAIAAYSGDENHLPVSGACNDEGESIDIGKRTPTFDTKMLPASEAPGAKGMPTDDAGASVVDTLVFVEGYQPTGTVTFTFFGPGDATCSGDPVFTSKVPANGYATLTSAPFAPKSSGMYRAIASYSGDGANEAVTAPCNEEGESMLVVIPASAGDPAPTDGVTPGPVADPAPEAGGLSRTGAAVDPTGAAAIGGGVLALGALLLATARRRRNARS